MSARWVLMIGLLLCGSSVILGAFGAHWLEDQLPNWFEDAAHRLENWQTGVLYQMFHGLGLVGLGATPLICGKWRGVAAGLMLLGVVLFSGGLYGWVVSDQKWMILVVPLGGLSLIAGWGAALAGVLFAPAGACGTQGGCRNE